MGVSTSRSSAVTSPLGRGVVDLDIFDALAELHQPAFLCVEPVTGRVPTVMPWSRATISWVRSSGKPWVS